MDEYGYTFVPREDIRIIRTSFVHTRDLKTSHRNKSLYVPATGAGLAS
jgi:hypothetical protein